MTTLVDKAREFAYNAHKGQVRKYNGKPYITHPERVAKRVSFYNNDENVVAAAWLHDVIEDCNVEFDTLFEKFNEKTAKIVLCLTNASKELIGKFTRAERKNIDREYLSHAPYGFGVANQVHLIKVIDRIDNLNELNGCALNFIKLYSEESLLLSEALTSAPECLVAELQCICNNYLGSY